jgi:hypothetical protein
MYVAVVKDPPPWVSKGPLVSQRGRASQIMGGRERTRDVEALCIVDQRPQLQAVQRAMVKHSLAGSKEG